MECLVGLAFIGLIWWVLVSFNNSIIESEELKALDNFKNNPGAFLKKTYDKFDDKFTISFHDYIVFYRSDNASIRFNPTYTHSKVSDEDSEIASSIGGEGFKGLEILTLHLCTWTDSNMHLSNGKLQFLADGKRLTFEPVDTHFSTGEYFEDEAHFRQKRQQGVFARVCEQASFMLSIDTIELLAEAEKVEGRVSSSGGVIEFEIPDSHKPILKSFAELVREYKAHM